MGAVVSGALRTRTFDPFVMSLASAAVEMCAVATTMHTATNNDRA
jgi:hypothetical protein